MSTTRRSDVVVPEILQEAIKSEFAGMTALAGSPAAIVNGSLPNTSQGGDTVKVPYFQNLGELDDLPNTEDAALTPRKLTMSSEQAVVQHSGVAFELTDWTKMAAAFADPYAEAARQVKIAVQRRADKALIDVASASLPAMTSDIYSASAPRKLDYDAVVDAKMLWADEQDDIVLMAHHSKTLGDLLKLKSSDGVPLLGTMADGSPGNFVGMPRRTSDRLTPTTDSPPKYTTLCLKRNAVIFWYTGSPVVETDRDILMGATVAAVHIYFVAYRYLRVANGTKPGVVIIRHN